LREEETGHKGSAAADERKIHMRRLPLALLPPKRRRPSRRGRSALAIALIVMVVAVSSYAASKYFSRAEFTLAARTMPVVISATVVFSGTSTPGYIPYQVMKLGTSASTTVSATDGPVISTKAKGSVAIYNIYSAQSQRLVAGTRLAYDSGLIYRLTGSVVVPGYSLSNGSTKPGSIMTTIVADQAGEDYDLARASASGDLKIVAYQGSPKYAGFYARLVTDIVGGENGQKKTVNPGILASSAAGLKAKMTTQLLAMAKAAVPAGSIMYDSAYVTDFAAPVVGGGSAHSATVSEQGTLYAVLFKTADLVSKLAGPAYAASFGSFAYSTPGLEALSFTVSNAKDFSPQNKSVLIARFSGSMKLVGVVPVADIKAKLAGSLLSETGNILRTYSQVIDIEKSTGELSPPWILRVPTDLKSVSVKVADGEAGAN
jgi:hypothetical protein